MVIDFKENIELLEKLIFNFVLTEDDNDVVIKPKSYETLDKREILPMIKAHYFNDDTLQRLYREAKKFFLEYKKIPTKNEIRQLANLANLDIPDDKFDKIFAINLKDHTYEFLYKYTKAFVFYKNLNEVVIDTLSWLKTTEINPDNVELITNDVRSKFNEKLNLSFTSSESGLSFFNPKDHIQLSKVGTPTGFRFFDKVLDGGWNPKTLVVFQGRPKVGKSMVLSNIAARAFLHGNDIGIATLELSDRKYMKRLGAQILNMTMKEYDTILREEDLNGIIERLNQLRETVPNLGNLEVKEFGAGTASAIDIENYFLKVQQRTGIKFKVIVVDYVNLMRPLRDRGDSYGNIKSITEELRAVAMRNEWCIISATQIKRDAVDDQDLNMSDVAESFGLVHTVDSLFGLTRGPMESRMKVKLIANRDGGYNESFKMFRLNYEYAKMIEETDPASEFYSDDDDTQSLENQMRNQYHTVQTTEPPNIDFSSDLPQLPPPIKPNKQLESHDDILDSIK
jgi:KaiC/GvpD/RAD55 family RecA-like ATPase